jgi:two-component system cell cycle response regulator DivK
MYDFSKWHVIIVDDEPDNIGVLEVVFNFHRTIVRMADSGVKCLQLLEEQLPTFLLVDIQMPGMSGYELVKIIRENRDWNHLPVIAVTAHAMPGDDERALAGGFDGYIPKPVNAMTVADEIRTILERKGIPSGR